MDEIGIAIRAKANLEEVDLAAQKLEKFGNVNSRTASKVRQLVESLKESADTDINVLTRQIDELQKKVQEGGLSRKERQSAKQQIEDLRTQIKELRQLQRVKADDYGSMEQEARLLLEHLKNKRHLTNAEKEHIKVIEEGLRYLERYNKAKLDLDTAHLDKIQKDLQEQEKEAEVGGMGKVGAYGKHLFRQITGVVIGGTIIGVLTQMMKKWSELDTMITKTSASLDGFGKAGVLRITEIGNALGYTKEEALAFLETFTAITGKIEKQEFANLLAWGRAMGVGASGLQLRELQRWGGEGVAVGTDKYFRSQFTAIARMLNMREGRMNEFIETSVNLVKTMERTFIKIERGDIFRNILFPAIVWGGADRGRGERGLSFMQRLNEALQGSSEMMKLMQYRALGVPQTWGQRLETMETLQKGAFGLTPAGNPLIISLIEQYKKQFGGQQLIDLNEEYKNLLERQKNGEITEDIKNAIEENTRKRSEIGAKITSYLAANLGIPIIEAKQMYRMYEGLEKGTWFMEAAKPNKELLKKLEGEGIEYGEITIGKERKQGFTNLNIDKFNKLITTFPEVVENFNVAAAISKGERWKIAIENMQFSVGGIFGPTVVSLLTGLARGVDAIASKFGGEYGYKSMRKNIDIIENEYNKAYKEAGLIQFPADYTKENLAKLEEKYNKAKAAENIENKNYMPPEELAKLEEKIRDIKTKINDPAWQLNQKLVQRLNENSGLLRLKTGEQNKQSTLMSYKDISSLSNKEIFNLDDELEHLRNAWVNKIKDKKFIFTGINQARKEIKTQLKEKYPKLSNDEIEAQLKYAEELIKNEIEYNLNINMQQYLVESIERKTTELQEIIKKQERIPNKGLKSGILFAKRGMLEKDLERLYDRLYEEQSKYMIAKKEESNIDLKRYPFMMRLKTPLEIYKYPLQLEGGKNILNEIIGFRNDFNTYRQNRLNEIKPPSIDEFRVANVRQFNVDNLIIRNPFEINKGQPTIINNYYHFNIEGGDIRNIQRNPETGEIRLMPSIGPRDNK